MKEVFRVDIEVKESSHTGAKPAFAQEEESLKHTPTSTHQKVRPSNRRSASRPSRPPQERFPSGPVPKWLRQSLWGGFT